MPRPLLLPAVIAMSLAACSPAPAPASSPAAAPAAAVAVEGLPVNTSAPAAPAPAAPEATNASATISGGIREGSRPPPALRVCAHPVAGGAPTCIETAADATAYRIEVAAGRYIMLAQSLTGPRMGFAHAERIRCIRAPCPPDTAIEVEVAAGEAKEGIDLSAGEALPPG